MNPNAYELQESVPEYRVADPRSFENLVDVQESTYLEGDYIVTEREPKETTAKFSSGVRDGCNYYKINTTYSWTYGGMSVEASGSLALGCKSDGGTIV